MYKIPPHFWAYICSTAFFGCRLREKWDTQSSQHFAQCVLCVSLRHLINCCTRFIVKGRWSNWRHEKSPNCNCLRVSLGHWGQLKWNLRSDRGNLEIHPTGNCLHRPLQKKTSNTPQLCSKSQWCPRACFILQLFFNMLRSFSVVPLSSCPHWASRRKLNLFLLRMCRTWGVWGNQRTRCISPLLPP